MGMLFKVLYLYIDKIHWLSNIIVCIWVKKITISVSIRFKTCSQFSLNTLVRISQMRFIAKMENISTIHTHTHILSFKVEFSKNQPFSLILFLLKWNKKKFVNYCKFVQSKYLISMKTQNKKRNNMGKRKTVSFNPCSNHSILPKFRPFVNRFPHTTKKWVLFLAFSENCSYWNRFIPYKNKCRTTDEFIHMNLPSVRDVVLVRKVFFNYIFIINRVWTLK